MRLFLAIELPDDVRQHLSRVRDRVKDQISKASFTRDENLHITLKFLGEADERKVAELTETLAHVRAGGTIEIFANALECFPSRGPVRIIAAGFGGDRAGLEAVHRAIEQRCEKLGFDSEKRAYRPHVTLVRARPTLPGSIRARAADAVAGEFPSTSFLIHEFVLMQSHLTHEGSRYEVLSRYPLRGID